MLTFKGLQDTHIPKAAKNKQTTQGDIMLKLMKLLHLHCYLFVRSCMDSSCMNKD